MEKVSDTQEIRNYIASNKGSILDVGYVSTHIFSHIPIDNLRKYISRFVKDGYLRKISKGIYAIGESDLSDKERIINYFTAYNQGILAGEAVLKKYGFIDYDPEIIEIRTNITSGNKYIESENIQIIESKSGFFLEEVQYIFEAIELLRYFNYVSPYMKEMYSAKIWELLEKNYSDLFFDRYLNEPLYKTSVYVLLDKYLKEMDISNRVMEIYENKRRLCICGD